MGIAQASLSTTGIPSHTLAKSLVLLKRKRRRTVVAVVMPDILALACMKTLTLLSGTKRIQKIHTTGQRRASGSSLCRYVIGGKPLYSSQHSHVVFNVHYHQLALTTFTVSFSSSSYSGGLEYIVRDLNVSDELAVLGISLYVLGFAVGYVVKKYFEQITRESMLQATFIRTNGRGSYD